MIRDKVKVYNESYNSVFLNEGEYFGRREQFIPDVIVRVKKIEISFSSSTTTTPTTNFSYVLTFEKLRGKNIGINVNPDILYNIYLNHLIEATIPQFEKSTILMNSMIYKKYSKNPEDKARFIDKQISPGFRTQVPGLNLDKVYKKENRKFHLIANEH